MFGVCLQLLLCIVAVCSAINNCRFDVKLEQNLVNEGFHRNITYKIVFNGDVIMHLYENCIVGLDQMLPAGVFANPDELEDLKRIQKLSVIPKNRVNIELPAEESQSTSVFIFSQVIGSTASTWLPVHARYHHSTPVGGFATNEIEPPRLYLRCPDRRLDQCDKVAPSVTFLCRVNSKEKCNWRQVPTTVLTETLVFNVPVGNTSAYPYVAAITACVIIGGSLNLLKTLHDYKIKTKNI